MKPIVLTVILALILVVPVSAREVDTTWVEPLGSVEVADLTINLGLLEFNLQPGDKDLLVKVHAIYESRLFEPEWKVDRFGKRAKIVLEMESDDNDFDFDDLRDIDNRYDVVLGPVPEYDIAFNLGLSEGYLDLTGLKITGLSFETGLSDTHVEVREPNQVETEYVSIETGLGEFTTEYLGNLRFKKLTFEGGMGSADLDLRGFEGRARMELTVGMGSIDLTIPKSVGVELDYEKNFFSSVSLKGFKRVGPDLYESKDFDSKDSQLKIKADVGMGSIDIRWRD